MSLVRFVTKDGVGVVTLDNPPLNLFTRQLTRELGEVLTAVERTTDVRAVVVCGTGSRAFSAGSDIREFPALMERGTVIEEKLSLENEVFERLAGLPQPTIAAISGVALGGGAELFAVLRLSHHERGRAYRLSRDSPGNGAGKWGPF